MVFAEFSDDVVIRDVAEFVCYALNITRPASSSQETLKLTDMFVHNLVSTNESDKKYWNLSTLLRLDPSHNRWRSDPS